MIRVIGLSKRFEHVTALDGLDFSVEKGEICALAGLKGAGKTTAMDIIAGCSAPDSGKVEICGIDIADEASSARQHIGYVPAEPPLYRDMTPRAYLKFLADARGMSSRAAAEKIDAAFRLLALQDVADKPVRALSRGVRQLASIAQAIFFEPDAILIDEPTLLLDPKDILALREAIRALKPDHAVLLASSNLTELCALADRVLVMDRGRIVSSGTPDQLHNMTRLDGTVSITLLGGADAVKDALGSVAQIVSLSSEGAQTTAVIQEKGDQRAQLSLAAAKAGLPILEMVPGRKTLDELLAGLSCERVEGSREPS